VVNIAAFVPNLAIPGGDDIKLSRHRRPCSALAPSTTSLIIPLGHGNEVSDRTTLDQARANIYTSSGYGKYALGITALPTSAKTPDEDLQADVKSLFIPFVPGHIWMQVSVVDGHFASALCRCRVCAGSPMRRLRAQRAQRARILYNALRHLAYPSGFLYHLRLLDHTPFCCCVFVSLVPKHHPLVSLRGDVFASIKVPAQRKNRLSDDVGEKCWRGDGKQGRPTRPLSRAWIDRRARKDSGRHYIRGKTDAV
jgi:hypothetical protein